MNGKDCYGTREVFYVTLGQLHKWRDENVTNPYGYGLRMGPMYWDECAGALEGRWLLVGCIAEYGREYHGIPAVYGCFDDLAECVGTALRYERWDTDRMAFGTSDFRGMVEYEVWEVVSDDMPWYGVTTIHEDIVFDVCKPVVDPDDDPMTDGHDYPFPSDEDMGCDFGDVDPDSFDELKKFYKRYFPEENPLMRGARIRYLTEHSFWWLTNNCVPTFLDPDYCGKMDKPFPECCESCIDLYACWRKDVWEPAEVAPSGNDHVFDGNIPF